MITAAAREPAAIATATLGAGWATSPPAHTRGALVRPHASTATVSAAVRSRPRLEAGEAAEFWTWTPHGLGGRLRGGGTCPDGPAARAGAPAQDLLAVEGRTTAAPGRHHPARPVARVVGVGLAFHPVSFLQAPLGVLERLGPRAWDRPGLFGARSSRRRLASRSHPRGPARWTTRATAHHRAHRRTDRPRRRRPCRPARGSRARSAQRPGWRAATRLACTSVPSTAIVLTFTTPPRAQSASTSPNSPASPVSWRWRKRRSDVVREPRSP